MCTAISYQTKDHYFGRNLDLEYSYVETVTITPRKYPFCFCREGRNASHYAMIGMAYVQDDYPLYYDATNEKGLSMASLSFPGNACYLAEKEGYRNVAPFELIPWVLGQCATAKEARMLLQKTNIIHLSYSEKLPLSPLHFMIADKERSFVAEPMSAGLILTDNPVGVLTNNPPFPYQMHHLNRYMGLSDKTPENTFAKELPLSIYSKGMGAIGLPGDLTSDSRFVKAAFTKWNLICDGTEEESISQFFHVLGAVEQQKGCVQPKEGEYEYTIYSSCCNTDCGIYYYKTYENSGITGVDMRKEELDGRELYSYPLLKKTKIQWQN